jgi:hypothetical protein
MDIDYLVFGDDGKQQILDIKLGFSIEHDGKKESIVPTLVRITTLVN